MSLYLGTTKLSAYLVIGSLEFRFPAVHFSRIEYEG